jgi:hypothetical protein
MGVRYFVPTGSQGILTFGRNLASGGGKANLCHKLAGVLAGCSLAVQPAHLNQAAEKPLTLSSGGGEADEGSLYLLENSNTGILRYAQDDLISKGRVERGPHFTRLIGKLGARLVRSGWCPNSSNKLRQLFA